MMLFNFCRQSKQRRCPIFDDDFFAVNVGVYFAAIGLPGVLLWIQETTLSTSGED